MTRTLLFWLAMLVWLVLSAWPHFHGNPTWNRIGAEFFAWVAVAILGWKIFGAPVKSD